MKTLKIFILIISSLFALGISSCSKKNDSEQSKKMPSQWPPSLNKSNSNSTIVEWKNFNEAAAEAKKDDKFIFVNFYANWCGYCRKMDREVFADSEVAQKLKKDYVSVKINTGVTDDIIEYKNHKVSSQGFSMMMGARGLPTSSFLDKNGEVVTTLPGYVGKETFLPLLSYIKDGCYSKNIPFKEYQADKTKCK